MFPLTFSDRSEPLLDSSMVDLAGRIKFELLSEYDRAGSIDIASWVRRYPAYREEIIDFWLWAKDTLSSAEDKVESFRAVDADVTEESLRNACLAVNLGSQWLSATVDPESLELDKLGSELKLVRDKPAIGGKASVAFRKAVVCAWTVSRLQRKRDVVSRLAVQKATYFLECALRLGIFGEYTRKPLGPYDYKSRYKDAEPIAAKKGWLTITGSSLHVHGDLPEVDRFAGRYLRSEELATRLVDVLANCSDSELETFATVHWIVWELANENCKPTVEAVSRKLASTPEWRNKLSRANFSDDQLRKAIQFLQKLRLVESN